ncbi:MAG: hypothetical protein JNM22_12440 [Saprospiraceae bacterium]|nr:hypothetical protein [Saprospiraceae bacterium]
MTNPQKEKKNLVGWILAFVAGLALLLQNVKSIHDFIFPDQATCEDTVAKVKIKKAEFEGADFQIIKADLISETKTLIEKYYTLDNCKNPATNDEIKIIKTRLIKIISEDLDALSMEYSESLNTNLISHINLLDIICRLSGDCSIEEKQSLEDLKKNIK